MDGAGRQKDVDPGPARVGQRLCAGVEVLLAGAAERRHGGIARNTRDGADALEVAGRGHGESGLDHVDPEPLELLGDFDLLVGLQRDSRRLLAVAERGVEDFDGAGFHVILLVASIRGRTSAANGGRMRQWRVFASSP